MNRTKIIACRTVANELASRGGMVLTCETIDAGLHSRPAQLKNAIQTAIDRNDGVWDPLVLGFGLCAQAVIGVHASVSTLMVPRVDDCISLLLGSMERYRNLLKEEPGTYFLSPGWIDAGITLVDEFAELKQHYGPARAVRIQKEMLKNYKRLALITTVTTGCFHRSYAKVAADRLGLSYIEIEGSERLTNLLVEGNREEADFIIARPGMTIGLEDFLQL